MAAKKPATVANVYTAVPVTKYTANWTIENFPTLTKTYTPGSVLESPEFEIKFFSSDSKLMITKWHFECFPAEKLINGNTSRYASIYLRVSEQTPCPSSTKFALKFSLGTSRSWNIPYCGINSANSSQHFRFSHEDLTAHPKDFLIEDKLCIKCDISILLKDCVRSYACNSLTDFNHLRLEMADINAKAKDRQAWQDLKADTFVDLGPGTVTMVFGRDEEKVEEQCHTFPLAARSPVFRKMLTVDMMEKATGRIEMPHISPATGRQCSEFVWFLLNESNRFQPLNNRFQPLNFCTSFFN